MCIRDRRNTKDYLSIGFLFLLRFEGIQRKARKVNLFLHAGKRRGKAPDQVAGFWRDVWKLVIEEVLTPAGRLPDGTPDPEWANVREFMGTPPLVNVDVIHWPLPPDFEAKAVRVRALPEEERANQARQLAAEYLLQNYPEAHAQAFLLAFRQGKKEEPDYFTEWDEVRLVDPKRYEAHLQEEAEKDRTASRLRAAKSKVRKELAGKAPSPKRKPK